MINNKLSQVNRLWFNPFTGAKNINVVKNAKVKKICKNDLKPFLLISKVWDLRNKANLLFPVPIITNKTHTTIINNRYNNS